MLRRLNRRRLRVNARVIKRKLSNWAVKRAHHHNPARPKAPPRDTIVITGSSRTAPQKRRPRVPAGMGPRLRGIGAWAQPVLMAPGARRPRPSRWPRARQAPTPRASLCDSPRRPPRRMPRGPLRARGLRRRVWRRMGRAPLPSRRREHVAPDAVPGPLEASPSGDRQNDKSSEPGQARLSCRCAPSAASDDPTRQSRRSRRL